MIAILDFGSQYSKVIARKIRESKVYCEVISHDTPLKEILKRGAKGIILSGGPSSVFDKKSPRCDTAIFDAKVPVLGICYGMQLMAQELSGEVVPGDIHEYGKASLYIDNNFNLFEGLWLETMVWMSHGDSVVRMPKGFQRIGHTQDCAIAAMADAEKKLFGLQFHPEVVHTPKGLDMIQNFVYKICGCEASWTADSFISTALKEVKSKVKDSKVLCALSGGG